MAIISGILHGSFSEDPAFPKPEYTSTTEMSAYD